MNSCNLKNAVIMRFFENIKRRPLVIPAVLAVLFMHVYIMLDVSVRNVTDISCLACVRSVDYKLDGTASYVLKTSEYGRILYNGTCGDLFVPGDEVYIEGRLNVIKPPTNPGEFDYSLYLRNKGISGVLYPDRIIRISECSYPARISSEVGLFFYEIRKYSLNVFEENDRGLAGALFMGDTSLVDDSTSRAFRLSNCSHLLAVSGTHFSGFLMILTEIISRMHLKKKRAGIALAVFCVLIGMFTGWSESVTRACVMSICCYFARDYLSGMSLAVILLAVKDPYSLLSSGFNMSFAASLSIRIFGDRIEKILGKTGLPSGVARALTPVFAAAIGMMPFWGRTCYYFSLTHLAVQMLASILACAACAFFIPTVITGLPFACSFVFDLLLALMRITSSTALGSLSSRGLSPLFIYSFFVLVCLYLMPAGIFRRHLMAPACIVVAISLGLMSADYISSPEVTVIFIDVGQGDCCLVMSEGRSLLIDGGVENEGRYAVSSVLDYYGIGSVDLAVATHMDNDHMGGLLYLDEAGRIDTLMTCYDLRAGDELMMTDELSLFCLWPCAVSDGGNEDSVVLRLEYGGYSILFTGDIGFDSEHRLVETRADVDADILKVSHHGSAYATSSEFIEAVSPETAVISVAEYNRYGHPSQETLERLYEYGSTVRRTDLEGAIIFEFP